MKLVKDFNEYQILDMADGMKLEVWNGVKLLRPDPQIIWKEKTHPEEAYQQFPPDQSQQLLL